MHADINIIQENNLTHTK